MAQIKNIREVTEPLKEQILKGTVHTIDEMRAWLKSIVYGDTKMLEFISAFRHHTSDIARMNMDMVVNLFRPQLEVTQKDIEPIIILGFITIVI